MQKSAVIAIIGKPNAGKSTLINNLVNYKVSIVTPKAQTTRNNIRGIVTKGETQLVFIDTPGIFQPKRALDKAMIRAAWSSITGADFVALVVDSKEELDKKFFEILSYLAHQKVNLILLLNKVDIASKEEIKHIEQEITELHQPLKIFHISALRGLKTEEFTSFLCESAPQEGWLYDEDDITTAPMRFLAAEITREKLFVILRDELPYGLTVENDSWQEQPDGSVRVEQTILVNRQAHKKMVLGSNGSMIKKISISARKDIEESLGLRCHLFLYVKVNEKWDTNHSTLKYMGFE